MRRRRAPKRKILPDPKYKNILVAKMINTVMERGKKSTAENKHPNQDSPGMKTIFLLEMKLTGKYLLCFLYLTFFPQYVNLLLFKKLIQELLYGNIPDFCGSKNEIIGIRLKHGHGI